MDCKRKGWCTSRIRNESLVLEDQHQFILHHRVMENETDDKVAVSMVQETQQKFPELNTCSFDKGFHSKENQSALADILEVVALPRKGRLSKEAQKLKSQTRL